MQMSYFLVMEENGDSFNMKDSKADIQIANIDSELSRLSHEKIKKGEIQGGLFNLIVYSQDRYRSIFLNDIVKSVTETFPCRIIFIECDSSSTQKFLKVTVEEEIIRKEGSTITCDRINIKFTPQYLERVPYLVLPHFVPDLPIYLLWGQDPSVENEVLPHLQSFATRLIFDSDSSCDIRVFCRKMLSDPTFSKIAVTDMNWASLTSWRQILLQIFDTKQKIEQLRNCKKISITYNNKETDIYQHTERRSLYLQGWLSAQLKWTYKNSTFTKDLMRVTYKNGIGETEVQIIGKSIPELTPGAIVDVEIRTHDEVIFDLTRLDVQPFIKAYITTKDSCELPFALPLRHSRKGLNFMNELFFAPCSEHYWNMLKAIEPIQVPC